MDSFNIAVPAAAPPPGVVPDFTHPQSRSNVAVAVCTASLVVTFFVFALRVYTRLRVLRCFGYDDFKWFFIRNVAPANPE